MSVPGEGVAYSQRIERLARLMQEGEIDAVVVSAGSDLHYLSGYNAEPSERPTLLVVESTGRSTLLVPELEAPRVGAGPFHLAVWGETDDPFETVHGEIGRSGRIAVGDRLWASFLLSMQRRIPKADWVPASGLLRTLRVRKDETELASLAEAARQADRVAERIPGEIRFEGATESSVSRAITQMLEEEGHDSTEFAIVASGPNAASPHHEPSTRVIQVGDLVVCDFGGRVDGYHSDTTRTFSVGEPSQQQQEIHGIVVAAQEAAKRAVRPGTECQAIDRTARSVIAEAGYGEFFIHRTGHGIGLDVHEDPYIVEGNASELEPGMAFSIEPGIYVPAAIGVRVEDIVVVTEDGIDTLNDSTRGLAVVG